MREVTDGSWHGEVARILDGHQVCSPDLDEDLLERRVAEAYSSFVISVEEYQDATGTDNKESFSLEPCLLSTGLLKSEFNGDHRSRFIIGYIPSFSKQKSSADQRRAGTKKVLDPAFAITTSVFQSSATVSQGSNGSSSSGCATWDQIKRAFS
jgi:hypothetical protein